jgi:GT2 family glycosyltransferase
MAHGVDILIPYHAQYSHVRKLVLSLLNATRGVPHYRITLIDDCSKNVNFFEEVKKFDYLDAIRLPEHKGFGAAVNAGIKHTKKPYIALLNSDCEIQEVNWLAELWKTYIKLSKSNNVRLVSACADNMTNGHPLQQQPRFNRDQEDHICDQALSLVACFFPRKLIEKVGYLKEYPYGYYEDEEFFYRMKKKKYNQAISGKSWIHHEGGLTVKYLWDKQPETKNIMLEENRNRCLKDIKPLI